MIRKAAILAVAAALLVGYIALVRNEKARFRPPADVRTLADFQMTMPPAEGCEVRRRDGHRYLSVYGPMRAIWTAASGPSAYVFDESGALIDWTSDSGDDGVFKYDWYAQTTSDEPRTEGLIAWPPR